MDEKGVHFPLNAQKFIVPMLGLLRWQRPTNQDRTLQDPPIKVAAQRPTNPDRALQDPLRRSRVQALEIASGRNKLFLRFCLVVINGFVWEMCFRSVDEAFKNYEGRRNGIIKALTKDVDKFREFNIEKTDCFLDCDAFKVTKGKRPGLYAFPNGEWEIRLKFVLEQLFAKMNELLTIYESVIVNGKNQEVATENGRKRVKDKSTDSYHSSKNSQSNSEVVQLKPLFSPYFFHFSKRCFVD
ncbi:hypothetical protein BC332_19849 [Capsicum chinense]|nr:hypothetical protein BC332_19849 [Capsicum chinense]